jgi:hypothetical protein
VQRETFIYISGALCVVVLAIIFKKKKKKKTKQKKISVIAFLDDGSKSSRSHSQHTGGKAKAGTCVICKLSSFHLFIASSFYSFSNIKVFFFFVIVVVFLIPGYEVASPGFFLPQSKTNCLSLYTVDA